MFANGSEIGWAELCDLLRPINQSQITKAGQIQALTNGLFAPSPSAGGIGGGIGGTGGGMAPGAGGGFSAGGDPSAPMQQPQGQAASGAGLRGIPLERVAQLKAMGGPDLLDAWKLANVPTQLSAGGYTQLPGQAPQYLADPSNGGNPYSFTRGDRGTRRPGRQAPKEKPRCHVTPTPGAHGASFASLPRKRTNCSASSVTQYRQSLKTKETHHVF